MDNKILESQRDFFDQHPFPGLNLDHIKTKQNFIYTVEKNELYRAISALLTSNKRLLDVGCGTGEFTTYLSLVSSAEVLGIDYSQASVLWAKKVKDAFGGNILAFKEADVFELLPADFGFFDYVLAMGLFPSIPNELVGMKRIANIVKPGGVVIFGFFDPVGRIYTRFKRHLLHSITAGFKEQKAICEDIFFKDIKDQNEVIWHVNQLTEEFLNYHSPKSATLLMESCGITVTDCYPMLKSFGNILQDKLNTSGEYKYPSIEILGQLNWLRQKTDGYYVLVGRKESNCDKKGH